MPAPKKNEKEVRESDQQQKQQKGHEAMNDEEDCVLDADELFLVNNRIPEIVEALTEGIVRDRPDNCRLYALRWLQHLKARIDAVNQVEFDVPAVSASNPKSSSSSSPSRSSSSPSPTTHLRIANVIADVKHSSDLTAQHNLNHQGAAKDGGKEHTSSSSSPTHRSSAEAEKGQSSAATIPTHTSTSFQTHPNQQSHPNARNSEDSALTESSATINAKNAKNSRQDDRTPNRSQFDATYIAEALAQIDLKSITGLGATPGDAKRTNNEGNLCAIVSNDNDAACPLVKGRESPNTQKIIVANKTPLPVDLAAFSDALSSGEQSLLMAATNPHRLLPSVPPQQGHPSATPPTKSMSTQQQLRGSGSSASNDVNNSSSTNHHQTAMWAGPKCGRPPSASHQHPTLSGIVVLPPINSNISNDATGPLRVAASSAAVAGGANGPTFAPQTASIAVMESASANVRNSLENNNNNTNTSSNANSPHAQHNFRVFFPRIESAASIGATDSAHHPLLSTPPCVPEEQPVSGRVQAFSPPPSSTNIDASVATDGETSTPMQQSAKSLFVIGSSAANGAAPNSGDRGAVEEDGDECLDSGVEPIAGIARGQSETQGSNSVQPLVRRHADDENDDDDHADKTEETKTTDQITTTTGDTPLQIKPTAECLVQVPSSAEAPHKSPPQHRDDKAEGPLDDSSLKNASLSKSDGVAATATPATSTTTPSEDKIRTKEKEASASSLFSHVAEGSSNNTATPSTQAESTPLPTSGTTAITLVAVMSNTAVGDSFAPTVDSMTVPPASSEHEQHEETSASAHQPASSAISGDGDASATSTSSDGSSMQAVNVPSLVTLRALRRAQEADSKSGNATAKSDPTAEGGDSPARKTAVRVSSPHHSSSSVEEATHNSLQHFASHPAVSAMTAVFDSMNIPRVQTITPSFAALAGSPAAKTMMQRTSLAATGLVAVAAANSSSVHDGDAPKGGGGVVMSDVDADILKLLAELSSPSERSGVAEMLRTMVKDRNRKAAVGESPKQGNPLMATHSNNATDANNDHAHPTHSPKTTPMCGSVIPTPDAFTSLLVPNPAGNVIPVVNLGREGGGASLSDSSHDGPSRLISFHGFGAGPGNAMAMRHPTLQHPLPMHPTLQLPTATRGAEGGGYSSGDYDRLESASQSYSQSFASQKPSRSRAQRRGPFRGNDIRNLYVNSNAAIVSLHPKDDKPEGNASLISTPSLQLARDGEPKATAAPADAGKAHEARSGGDFSDGGSSSQQASRALPPHLVTLTSKTSGLVSTDDEGHGQRDGHSPHSENYQHTSAGDNASVGGGPLGLPLFPALVVPSQNSKDTSSGGGSTIANGPLTSSAVSKGEGRTTVLRSVASADNMTSITSPPTAHNGNEIGDAGRSTNNSTSTVNKPVGGVVVPLLNVQRSSPQDASAGILLSARNTSKLSARGQQQQLLSASNVPPPPPPPPPQPGVLRRNQTLNGGARRRVGVHEIRNVEKAVNFVLKEHPKTPEEEAVLTACVDKCTLFTGFEENERKKVVSAMFPMEFNAGYEVLSQGFPGRDTFFLIISGKAEVLKDSKVVVTLGQGEYFGELEMMYHTDSCAATIKCITPLITYALEKETYANIVLNATLARRKIFLDQIKLVEFFQVLSDYDQMRLAEALSIKKFERDQFLIRHGEQVDFMYMIMSGVVSVIGRNKADPTKREHVVDLGAGQVVGELEFLFQHNAIADVIAVSGLVTVAKLSRPHFVMIMGDMFTELKSHVANGNYGHYLEHVNDEIRRDVDRATDKVQRKQRARNRSARSLSKAKDNSYDGGASDNDMLVVTDVNGVSTTNFDEDAIGDNDQLQIEKHGEIVMAIRPIIGMRPVNGNNNNSTVFSGNHPSVAGALASMHSGNFETPNSPILSDISRGTPLPNAHPSLGNMVVGSPRTAAQPVFARFPAAVTSGDNLVMIVIQEDGTIIHWNDVIARLTQFKAEDVIGQSIFSFLTNEDQQKMLHSGIRSVCKFAGDYEGFLAQLEEDGNDGAPLVELKQNNANNVLSNVFSGTFANTSTPTPAFPARRKRFTVEFVQFSGLYRVHLSIDLAPPLVAQPPNRPEMLLIVGHEIKRKTASASTDYNRWFLGNMDPLLRGAYAGASKLAQHAAQQLTEINKQLVNVQQQMTQTQTLVSIRSSGSSFGNQTASGGKLSTVGGKDVAPSTSGKTSPPLPLTPTSQAIALNAAQVAHHDTLVQLQAFSLQQVSVMRAMAKALRNCQKVMDQFRSVSELKGYEENWHPVNIGLMAGTFLTQLTADLQSRGNTLDIIIRDSVPTNDIFIDAVALPESILYLIRNCNRNVENSVIELVFDAVASDSVFNAHADASTAALLSVGAAASTMNMTGILGGGNGANPGSSIGGTSAGSHQGNPISDPIANGQNLFLHAQPTTSSITGAGASFTSSNGGGGSKSLESRAIVTSGHTGMVGLSAANTPTNRNMGGGPSTAAMVFSPSNMVHPALHSASPGSAGNRNNVGTLGFPAVGAAGVGLRTMRTAGLNHPHSQSPALNRSLDSAGGTSSAGGGGGGPSGSSLQLQSVATNAPHGEPAGNAMLAFQSGPISTTTAAGGGGTSQSSMSFGPTTGFDTVNAEANGNGVSALVSALANASADQPLLNFDGITSTIPSPPRSPARGSPANRTESPAPNNSAAPLRTVTSIVYNGDHRHSMSHTGPAQPLHETGIYQSMNTTVGGIGRRFIAEEIGRGNSRAPQNPAPGATAGDAQLIGIADSGPTANCPSVADIAVAQLQLASQSLRDTQHTNAAVSQTTAILMQSSKMNSASHSELPTLAQAHAGNESKGAYFAGRVVDRRDSIASCGSNSSFYESMSPKEKKLVTTSAMGHIKQQQHAVPSNVSVPTPTDLGGDKSFPAKIKRRVEASAALELADNAPAGVRSPNDNDAQPTSFSFGAGNGNENNPRPSPTRSVFTPLSGAIPAESGTASHNTKDAGRNASVSLSAVYGPSGQTGTGGGAGSTTRTNVSSNVLASSPSAAIPSTQPTNTINSVVSPNDVSNRVLQITIRDRGPGINPQIIKKVNQFTNQLRKKATGKSFGGSGTFGAAAESLLGGGAGFDGSLNALERDAIAASLRVDKPALGAMSLLLGSSGNNKQSSAIVLDSFKGMGLMKVARLVLGMAGVFAVRNIAQQYVKYQQAMASQHNTATLNTLPVPHPQSSSQQSQLLTNKSASFLPTRGFESAGGASLVAAFPTHPRSDSQGSQSRSKAPSVSIDAAQSASSQASQQNANNDAHLNEDMLMDLLLGVSPADNTTNSMNSANTTAAKGAAAAPSAPPPQQQPRAAAVGPAGAPAISSNGESETNAESATPISLASQSYMLGAQRAFSHQNFGASSTPSQIPQGTEFVITIPLAISHPDDDDDVNAKNGAVAEAGGDGTSPGGNVRQNFTTILVENTAVHRNMICQLLWGRKHAVLPASGWKDVARLADGGTAEILIVDPESFADNDEEVPTTLLGGDMAATPNQQSHDLGPIERLTRFAGKMAIIIMSSDFNELAVGGSTVMENGVICLPKPCPPALLHNAILQAENLMRTRREEERRIAKSREAFSKTNHAAIKKIRMLGRGAFGEVHEVEDTITKGRMAMKILQTKNEADANEVLKEIQAMTTLKHENIIHYIYCEKVDDRNLKIFMELASGGTVADKIKETNGQGLPIETISSYVRDILKGLDYIHKNRWVHCDIKPQNVLLDREGRCKLGDFGTATHLEPDNVIGVTALKGTPSYMAPEVVEADDVLGHGFDMKADIWALGVTVMEMATAQAPFSHVPEAKGRMVMMYVASLKEKGETPNLSPLFNCDPLIFEFVQACLNTDPTARPTAEQLMSYGMVAEAGPSAVGGGAGKLLWRAQLLHILNQFVAFKEEVAPAPSKKSRSTVGGTKSTGHKKSTVNTLLTATSKHSGDDESVSHASNNSAKLSRRFSVEDVPAGGLNEWSDSDDESGDGKEITQHDKAEKSGSGEEDEEGSSGSDEGSSSQSGSSSGSLGSHAEDKKLNELAKRTGADGFFDSDDEDEDDDDADEEEEKGKGKSSLPLARIDLPLNAAGRAALSSVDGAAILINIDSASQPSSAATPSTGVQTTSSVNKSPLPTAAGPTSRSPTTAPMEAIGGGSMAGANTSDPRPIPMISDNADHNNLQQSSNASLNVNGQRNNDDEGGRRPSLFQSDSALISNHTPGCLSPLRESVGGPLGGASSGSLLPVTKLDSGVSEDSMLAEIINPGGHRAQVPAGTAASPQARHTTVSPSEPLRPSGSRSNLHSGRRHRRKDSSHKPNGSTSNNDAYLDYSEVFHRTVSNMMSGDFSAQKRSAVNVQQSGSRLSIRQLSGTDTDDSAEED